MIFISLIQLQRAPCMSLDEDSPSQVYPARSWRQVPSAHGRRKPLSEFNI